MGCEEGSEKKRKKHKKEEILQKKNHQKRNQKSEGKILGKEANTASRYPVKATIAHTRIQRESNFASFEG